MQSNNLSWNNICPSCSNFNLETGECSQFNENISMYPNKFQSLCSGNFFIQNNEEPIIDIDASRKISNKAENNIEGHVNIESNNKLKREYPNKRFLSERVLFIATSGFLPALFTQIPQLLFGVPLFILLFYVPAYILFRVGSLTVTFEGEIPDWAKSKFSWKRFGMEYLYFIGIFAAGSLAIILYRLVTGQI